jgi:hypothetical protein
MVLAQPESPVKWASSCPPACGVPSHQFRSLIHDRRMSGILMEPRPGSWTSVAAKSADGFPGDEPIAKPS